MFRIGIDFGGTKIEAAALDGHGQIVARERLPNPGNYKAAVEAVAGLARRIEDRAGGKATVGVGVPGSISPATGRMRNANSTWLNGKPFREDLSAALGREVRLTNDADCFALSEAADGAAAGAPSVFGAILGTGCGGGVIVNGALLDSRNDIAGEWGHTPLPWPSHAELDHPPCWCGRKGCLETWISGTGFREDHERVTGEALSGAEIVAKAAAGDAGAVASLDRYIDRLARGLAVICDVLDPHTIVLGGGMSNVDALYERVPQVMAPYVFSDVFTTPIVKAKWGDSSGVRGAAWLWPLS
ncbi:MAG: ROK family protein [Proteobacteria bacterium]|nr:ROK family protein [Pseudomonadota bacterium]